MPTDTTSIAAKLRNALGTDGFLSDLQEVANLDELTDRRALAPWDGLSVKVYRSSSATAAIRELLALPCPGLPVSYSAVIDAVREDDASAYCYLIGGQV